MKEEFKKFVRGKPELIDYVTNNKMTWQQFYEIYDLYGENNSIWNNFKKKDGNENNNISKTIKDFLNLFKGIDAKKIQSTLTSINKVLDTFREINDSNSNTNSYEERPKYKYFED